MIDAYATLPHLVEHIAPIWRALPDDLRGTFQASGEAGYRANQLGIRLGMLDRGRGHEAPLTIVASYMDEQYVRPRPVVLVEHGAGQHYGSDDPGIDRHPAYPGGTQRGSVCLFLCPSERVARRWAAFYPDTPTAVVGCPYLDPWHLTAGDFHDAQPWLQRAALDVDPSRRRAGDLPLVVFSFHWDCQVVPECRSAFEHYQSELRRLARMDDGERGFRMAGHAHPRAHEVMAWWRGERVPTITRFADVLDQADVYVCDNSSTIFEFASTDRPVVVLNAPWYRRDVEHGGRFWDWANVGVECDEPDGLATCVEIAMRDEPSYRAVRQSVVRDVYAYTDGHATERAVAAIVATYEEGHWRAWREIRLAHDPFAATGAAGLDDRRAEVVRRLRELGRPLEADLADRLRHASEDDLRDILDLLH